MLEHLGHDDAVEKAVCEWNRLYASDFDLIAEVHFLRKALNGSLACVDAINIAARGQRHSLELAATNTNIQRLAVARKLRHQVCESWGASRKFRGVLGLNVVPEFLLFH